jgi:hypothetical protein
MSAVSPFFGMPGFMPRIDPAGCPDRRVDPRDEPAGGGFGPEAAR